jgi:hypothetical protein
MTTTISQLTELAHRTSAELHVYLFWNKPTSRVTVRVLDTRLDDSFEFEADGRYALDAFIHPYAYAVRTDTVAASDDTGTDSLTTTANTWRTNHARTDR